MLTVDKVTKRYGTLTALDAVSLEVKAGECLGLLGPNGAGKSTLMSLISGLRAADAGTITVNGMKVGTDEQGPRGCIGLVTQGIALYTSLTAEQNLRIFGELCGLSGKELHSRVNEALEAVQLADRRRDFVSNFSGGMQRRLNLVAALMHRPQLLLCDEPTVGVDPQSRNAIFELLERERARGMTIIYSTHYMEEAERLCPRIAIIDHGRILEQGSLESLLAKLPRSEELRFPADERTAALLPALAGRGDLFTEGAEHHFVPGADMPLSAFFAATEKLNLAAHLFTRRRTSLENVFLHLTGRSLRE